MTPVRPQPVIPAQGGTQIRRISWIPSCAHTRQLNSSSPLLRAHLYTRMTQRVSMAVRKLT
jgi:hypothetical protein